LLNAGHAARFEKSKFVEPWAGVYNATKNGHNCPQFDHNAHPQVDIDEDCLFLNVWQPVSAESTAHPKAVLVFIHGGGFTAGTGNGDSRYMAHDGDVVVVTIHYRLGTLGFLHTDMVDHEGNYGLMDQQLALHWVQENIAHFGGDPAQVTIFGQSAGSWSVSAQILSPLSKGLFKRAIMQSGGVQSVMITKEQALKNTERLATELKCPHDGSTATLMCLRGKTHEKLRNVSL